MHNYCMFGHQSLYTISTQQNLVYAEQVGVRLVEFSVVTVVSCF